MRRILVLAAVASLALLGCPPKCPEGQTLCGDVCVALDSDAANCGACGTSCSGEQACTAGACACPSTAPDACGTGAATVCKNLATDLQYCGSCDIACNAGDYCSDGVCADTCTAGQTACPVDHPTYCVTTDSNVNNCGACGNNCALDRECNSGACEICTPSLATQTSPSGAIPGGLTTDCATADCPVVQCGSITYWFFSYIDNRFSYNVVGYAANGAIVRGPTERPGDRYVQSMTLNTGDQTVSVTGQSFTITVPWSEFRLPP